MATCQTFTLGLDGCRAGWIAASWRGPGSVPAFTLLRRFTFGSLRQAGLACARQIAIDIPIGLPESGRRACDLAARAALPPGTRSRVFLDLRRPLLHYLPDDYQSANTWGKADGKGLSKQAWFILPKVAEVDTAVTPADQALLREVHPEVIFHRLSSGQPLPSKKTPLGRDIRLELLADAGLTLAADWDRQFPRRDVQLDDLIDAAGCALAAHRIDEGRATALPLDGFNGARGSDSRGLAMEIWA
ncbi:MAG: DUF429 domain-containing protein [Kiloniellales bacterium]